MDNRIIKLKEEFKVQHAAILAERIDEITESLDLAHLTRETEEDVIREKIGAAMQFFSAISAAESYLEQLLNNTYPEGTQTLLVIRNSSLIGGSVYAKREFGHLGSNLIRGEIDMSMPHEALFEMFLNAAFSEAGVSAGIELEKASDDAVDIFLIHYRVICELNGFCRGLLESFGVAVSLIEVVWNLRRAEGSRRFATHLIADIPPAGEMH